MQDKDQIYSLNINKGDELLPVGSVVTIDLVQQAVMIYGRKQEQNSKVLWDYVACPYPQGHLSENTNVFFNHEHITNVIFKGFESEGELALRKMLNETGEKTK